MEPREEGERLARDIQSRLEAHAQASTREWFQTQGLGRWRGCEQACIRARTLEAEQEGRPCDASAAAWWGEARYHASLELMRSEFADDKLSGMTMFQVRERPESRARARAHRSQKTKKKSPRLSSDPRAPSAPRRATRPTPRLTTVSRPQSTASQELVLPDPNVSARLFGDEDDDEEDDDDESSSPRPAGSSMSIADADAKPSGEFLPDALALFDDPSARGVHDWSTSDAIAFKVLGPYVAAHPRRRRTARFVLAWATRPSSRGSPPVNPYRRRAGVVAFLNYVDGETDAGVITHADSSNDAFPRSGRGLASSPVTHRGRGGDGLFGDGFVAELAKACGDVLAAVDSETPAAARRIPRGAERGAGGAEVSVRASDDEVQIDDPTLSPMAAEAWAVDGAWAVLGLCARESARVDRARIAAERGGGNRRTFPCAVNSGGEETHAGGGASKRARTEA
ncbi:predicted protein [Micromonas commoda]|uniref:Uncharacterized protein n=1 Tax=Micromonas commoda (strain RCC299 / NOUM17 / CCMP2709) TaxID=296587 RepID=C1FI05_MICCC|nr:predicted protein [Micromonas commoda]ACO69908.1 predicted protein [Micromonas commoda]|eukprot:XP_002508650.1 predicted protein [Micromonas commoda]